MSRIRKIVKRYRRASVIPLPEKEYRTARTAILSPGTLSALDMAVVTTSTHIDKRKNVK